METHSQKCCHTYLIWNTDITWLLKLFCFGGKWSTPHYYITSLSKVIKSLSKSDNNFIGYDGFTYIALMIKHCSGVFLKHIPDTSTEIMYTILSPVSLQAMTAILFSFHWGGKYLCARKCPRAYTHIVSNTGERHGTVHTGLCSFCVYLNICHLYYPKLSPMVEKQNDGIRYLRLTIYGYFTKPSLKKHQIIELDDRKCYLC